MRLQDPSLDMLNSTMQDGRVNGKLRINPGVEPERKPFGKAGYWNNAVARTE